MFNNFLYFATVLLAIIKSCSFNFLTTSESDSGDFLSSSSTIRLMTFLSSFAEAIFPDLFIRVLENKLFNLIYPTGESIYLFFTILLILEISLSTFFAISSNLSGFKNSALLLK